MKVGYYTEVTGLGASHADVTINGKIEVYNRCLADGGTSNCHALVNFWRTLSNLSLNINGAGQDGCRASANFWAVSQASSMRRLNIAGGNLSLMEYCTAGPQYASGGFIADAKLPFVINGPPQQQWLTRNPGLLPNPSHARAYEERPRQLSVKTCPAVISRRAPRVASGVGGACRRKGAEFITGEFELYPAFAEYVETDNQAWLERSMGRRRRRGVRRATESRRAAKPPGRRWRFPARWRVLAGAPAAASLAAEPRPILAARRRRVRGRPRSSYARVSAACMQQPRIDA
jgi:hypothetical protein